VRGLDNLNRVYRALCDIVISMRHSYVGQIPSFHSYKPHYNYEDLNMIVLTTNNQILRTENDCRKIIESNRKQIEEEK
jgi:hypothetical protein